MLRLKVYLNEKEIDEIRILRTKERNNKGEYKYKIILPKEYEYIEVWHDRLKPWHVLAEKVLKKLNKTDYNNINNRVADGLTNDLLKLFKYENKKKN